MNQSTPYAIEETLKKILWELQRIRALLEAKGVQTTINITGGPLDEESISQTVEHVLSEQAARCIR